VHRQHQNGANQHEKNVLTPAYRFHSATHLIENAIGKQVMSQIK
jgi:hypothetical protein